MKIRAKAAMSAASILIVAAGAAGCGGGSDSDSKSGSDTPAGASQKDFCGAFSTFETNLAGVDPSSAPKDIVSKFKSEASKLRDTGTPDNISSSASKGFDAVLDAIASIPDDASLEDLSKLDSTLSDADKTNAEAFQTYLDKECPDLSQGSDSGSGAADPSAS